MLPIKQDYLARNKYSYSLLGVTFEKKKTWQKKKSSSDIQHCQHELGTSLFNVNFYAGKIF